jgi:hypothetical protein
MVGYGPVYSGDKLIRARAIIEDIDSKIIYEGYDLDLLYDMCKQVCADGMKDGSVWLPPHKIQEIKLEVDDYDGTFEEYEKELTERINKIALERLEK